MGLCVVRRRDRDVPMARGWDHQCSQVSIVDVERDWLDYAVVLTAFFDRERRDKMAPHTTRASHEVVKVRRIQNQLHSGLFEAQGKIMVQKPGKSMVDLITLYVRVARVGEDAAGGDSGRGRVHDAVWEREGVLWDGELLCGAGEIQRPRTSTCTGQATRRGCISATRASIATCCW